MFRALAAIASCHGYRRKRLVIQIRAFNLLHMGDEEDLIFYNLEKACKSVLIESDNQTETINVSRNHSFDEKHKCDYYVSQHLKSQKNVAAQEFQTADEAVNYYAKPVIDITTTKTEDSFFTTNESEICKINYTSKRMKSAQMKNCLNEYRLTQDQLETSLELLQAVKYCLDSRRNETSKHRKGKVRFRLP